MGDSSDTEEKKGPKRKRKNASNGACCAAINCGNSKKSHPKLSFFRFPLDEKRSREWVKNTQRPDILGRDATYLYHNLKLCSEHFEDCMFLNNIQNRLHKHAVPTLFDKPNLHSPYRKVRKRKINYKNEKLASKPSSGTFDKEHDSKECDTSVLVDVGSESGSDQSAISYRIDSCSGTEFKKSKKAIPKDMRQEGEESAKGHFDTREYNHQANGSPVQLNNNKLQCDNIKGSQEIHKVVLNQNTILKELDGESDAEKGVSGSDRIVQLPDNSLFIEFASPKRQVLLKLPPLLGESELRGNSLEDLLSSLSDMKLLSWDALDRLRAFKTIPRGLWKMSSKFKSCKVQFTEEVNKFATCLYISSPEAYDIVSKEFELPDKSSVRLQIQMNNYRPGFTKQAIEILKNQVARNSANKLCSVMFDTITIRKAHQLNHASDDYIGQEDLGHGLNLCDSDEIPLATEILMFTVVGLGSRWKLPFGYFPIANLSGEVLKNLAAEAIYVLEMCGLEVRAVVCRGCSRSLEMLKILGCNMQKTKWPSLSTSICHPWKQERKIYIIFDIQQCLELLKNLLKDEAMLRSSVYGKIKWSYLRQVFQKPRHYELEDEDHVKFCNAWRIISNCKPGFTTLLANALEMANILGIKDFEGNQGTCNFIADVVRGLQLLNSKHFCGLWDNPPILHSTVQEQAESMVDIAGRLFNLELVSGDCISDDGRWMSVALFATTLKSVASLASELLYEESLEHFPTYRINMDHFDMVLSSLQRIGDWSLPPTACEFQKAYEHLFEKSSKSKFCHYDFEGEDLTVGQGEIYQLRHFPKENVSIEDIVYSCDIIDLDADITYRARLLIQKVSKRLSCPECIAIIVDMETNLSYDHPHCLQNGKYIDNILRPSKYVLKLMLISERTLKREMIVLDDINTEYLVSCIFREYSHLVQESSMSYTDSFHNVNEPYHVICLSKVLIRNIVTARLARKKRFKNRVKKLQYFSKQTITTYDMK